MFEVFRQSLCTKNGQPFSGRYKQLLLHLKELAFKFGHTPSCNEINKAGKFTHYIYLTCFGTARNAQALAGLVPNKKYNSFEYARRNANYITREECLADISRIHSKLGKYPPLDQLKKLGKYAYMMYYRRLGGVRKIKTSMLQLQPSIESYTCDIL